MNANPAFPLLENSRWLRWDVGERLHVPADPLPLPKSVTCGGDEAARFVRLDCVGSWISSDKGSGKAVTQHATNPDCMSASAAGLGKRKRTGTEEWSTHFACRWSRSNPWHLQVEQRQIPAWKFREWQCWQNGLEWTKHLIAQTYLQILAPAANMAPAASCGGVLDSGVFFPFPQVSPCCPMCQIGPMPAK